MKLFALLIGINDYSPASVTAIRPLQACLHDVAQMHTFLTTYYKELLHDEAQIMTLTNAQATRENVIAGFKNHLTQAKAGDVALVYYSGHGSEGITALDFQKFTSDLKEQTWVLYDSREAGKYDLADKEIALLLEEIAQNQPHLVVISDSCHAGSVTREIEDFMPLQPRFTSGSNEPRPLESYLEGAYLKRASLAVPASNHLLLAACERTERAWEAQGEGQFTKALLKVLNKNAGRIQYADLFVQVRAAIKSQLKNQTPQLETLGNSSARQGFLGQSVTDRILGRYQVVFDKVSFQWKIELGADRGLEPTLGEEMQVKIFENSTDENSLGTAKVKDLGLTNSALEAEPKTLDKENVYWGEPTNALALSPFYVYAEAETKTLMESVSTLESGIVWVETAAAASVEVKMKEGEWGIYQPSTETLIQYAMGSNAAVLIWNALQPLARWHRLMALKNPKTKLTEESFDLTFEIQQNNQTYSLNASTITLDFEDEDIPFEIKLANNTKQKWYAALLYLSPNYGVQVFSLDFQTIGVGQQLSLLEHTFTLNNGNDEEIDTFKVLLSSEPIDTFLFEQEGLVMGKLIDASRSLGRGIGGNKKSDWFTKTTTVRVVRKGKEIAGQEPIAMGKGIEIQPHPSFRGNANWVPLHSSTRTVSELAIRDEYFRTNPYYQIVSLEEGAKGIADKTILEISDIQNQETLIDNPLVVTVQTTEEEEISLPMFFDGEDFLPLGKTTLDENGNLRFEITHIPDEIEAAKTRSLGSALKMVVVKFAKKIGFKGETQLLRWVDYSDADKAKRVSEDLKEKIAKADKILLLIHGIIGDTEEMAETFRMATTKGYDLVLTYDYENLNTPIEENARILKKKLQAVGFGKEDGKKLVLVVHSMGGLVARYMIERLAGDDFVDKLIMAGTPNGGSKFGDVPGYINWAAIVLGFGTRFFPPQVGAVTGFLSGLLKGTNDVLLKALSQMSAEDSFIQDLNEGHPPTIPYVVFGGNLEAYLVTNDSDTFMEKVLAQVGEWVYKDEDNDIAVSLENIFKVRNSPTYELACHHLNYFVEPIAVAALEKAIGEGI